MKVIDLEGNISTLSLVGYLGKTFNKSDLHIQAREILRKCYPNLNILEEVSIQIRKGQNLFLDFFLPLNRRCIEVHGAQHYNFTTHFHKTKLDFLKQQKRDSDKREWLEKNSIIYIELPYNKVNEWLKIIQNN